MNTLDFTASPSSLPQMLSHVASTHESVIITQTNQPPIIMMPLDEYESMKETIYLLGNPANAKHILYSLEHLRKGNAESKELIG